MKYKIYSLIDPRDRKVKYVGITSKGIYYRLVAHIHEAFSNRVRIFSTKGKWLKELIESNSFPMIELLEETSEVKREVYWINKLQPELNVVLSLNSSIMKDHRINGRSKAVYQYTLKGTFVQKWKSATLVESILGIEATNISACINGTRKHAGSFMWKDSKFEKIPIYKKDRLTKEVHQYTLQGEYVATYPSMSRIPGFTLKGISKCCNGDIQSHLGFKFSLVKV